MESEGLKSSDTMKRTFFAPFGCGVGGGGGNIPHGVVQSPPVHGCTTPGGFKWHAPF